MEAFKEFFYCALLQRRTELKISQEEMAHRLAMSSRDYIKLDHKKRGCGGLTSALFLVYVCEDPIRFLEDLRHEFETALVETA